MSIAVNYPKTVVIYQSAYIPHVDLSGYQYRAVAPYGGATGKAGVTSPSGKGVLCIGVLQNAPTFVAADDATNVVAQVLELGVTPLSMNGTCNAGVEVAVGVDGRGQAAVSGDYVLGISRNAATAAYEIIALDMTRGGYYKA